MAIEFDDASSEYLHASSLIVSPPFSVSAWFYVDDDDTEQRLFSLYGTGANRHECRLNAGPLRTISAVSSTLTEASAVTDNGFGLSAWHHGLWSLDSGRRTATLDGGTTAVNTDARAANVANSSVAGPSLLMSGRIAELAIWDVDLSLAEDWGPVKASLAKGFSPLAVRPASLAAWLRFLNGEIQDVIGGFTFSVNGTPVAAPHPRLWTPRRSRQVLRPLSALPPARIISLGGLVQRGSRVVLAG